MVGDAKNLAARVAGRRCAFTLVELIVVIGIIAVLLALVLPVMGRVRSSANLVTCASNVRQIVLLMGIYAHSNDGRLPYRVVGLDDWSASLAPLGSGRGVFACPSDDNPRRDTVDASTIRSYGINNGPFAALGETTHLRAPWPIERDALPARLHQVRHHVFLVGDNGGQFPLSAAFVTLAEAEALDGIAWGVHRLKHRRGDNYGFADGHVEYRLKEELDRLAADPDEAVAGGLLDPWKWR